MDGIGAPARSIPHAFPYVAGVSKRFKAGPTPLNRNAASIMAASGAFSYRGAAGGGVLLRIGCAIAILAAALGLAFGGTAPPPEDAYPAVLAAPILPDAFHALGVAAYRAPADAGAGKTSELGAQDRFEIARFHRLYEAARQRKPVVQTAAARGPGATVTIRKR